MNRSCYRSAGSLAALLALLLAASPAAGRHRHRCQSCGHDNSCRQPPPRLVIVPVVVPVIVRPAPAVKPQAEPIPKPQAGVSAAVAGAGEPQSALGEVNAARAARGLPPFVEDAGLTTAATGAARYRAANRLAGHVPGPMGDFQFLPAGSWAWAAGCAAWEPVWGWGSCCTYEPWRYAGAAAAVGGDGLRYMHLFVR